jgi:hypothetical protein
MQHIFSSYNLHVSLCLYFRAHFHHRKTCFFEFQFVIVITVPSTNSTYLQIHSSEFSAFHTNNWLHLSFRSVIAVKVWHMQFTDGKFHTSFVLLSYGDCHTNSLAVTTFRHRQHRYLTSSPGIQVCGPFLTAVHLQTGRNLCHVMKVQHSWLWNSLFSNNPMWCGNRGEICQCTGRNVSRLVGLVRCLQVGGGVVFGLTASKLSWSTLK